MSDGTPAALEAPLRAMSDSDSSSLLNELHDALGQIIADERRQWQRDLALIEAQARTVIAELRAQNLELRTAFEAKLAEFSGKLTERDVELDEVLLSCRVEDLMRARFSPARRSDRDVGRWREREEGAHPHLRSECAEHLLGVLRHRHD